MTKKKYDESIAILKEAIALDDRVARSYAYLALVQISAGEKYYADGLNSLERAVQLSPDIYQQEQGVVTAYYMLLQYYYKAHDVRAKVCAEQLQTMVPEKKEGLDAIIKNIEGKTWQYIEFK